MPRYELIEGKASKFWKIERSGKSFTTTYGRIGSSGQTTTKKFGSEAETAKQHDKLVGEKIGKGYKLVGEQAAVQPQHLGQVYGDTAVLLALLLDGGAAGRWRGVEGGEYDAVLPVIRNRDAAPYTVASRRGWLLAVGNSILHVFKRADDEVVLVGMLGEDDEDDEREAEFVAQAALGASGPVKALGAVSVASGTLAIFSAPCEGPDRKLLARASALARGAQRFEGGLAFPLKSGAYTLFTEKVKAPIEQRYWLLPRGRAVPVGPARPAHAKTGKAEPDAASARVLDWPGKTTVTHSIAFSPDGTLLAAGGQFEGSVCVWRVADGEVVHRAKGLSGGRQTSGVEVCFNKTGELIARCNRLFSGWRTPDFAPIDFRALNAKIPVDAYARNEHPHFCISPSDGRLALDHADGALCLTDAKRRKLFELGPYSVARMAFTPDGRRLVTAGQEPLTWNVARRKLEITSKLPAGHYESTDLALFPDRKRLIVSLYGRLAIYRLGARAPAALLKDVPSQRGRRWITTVAVDASGRWRATARSDDRSVYLWDGRTNKLVRSLRGHLPSHTQSNSYHRFRFAFAPATPLLAVNAGLKGLGGAVTLHTL